MTTEISKQPGLPPYQYAARLEARLPAPPRRRSRLVWLLLVAVVLALLLMLL